MRFVIVYDDDDMMSATALADHFGYSRDYVRAMLNIHDKAADPALIRLKIETTSAWRRAHYSRAHFVFRYVDAKAWYDKRQRKPSVKHKTWARKYTPQGLDVCR